MTSITVAKPVRRRVPPTVDEALAVVGCSADEVREVIAAYGGEPYLVGSLAAGFGDRSSDVDVYIVSDEEHGEGPVLAFTAAGVCVDVRHVRRSSIERVLAGQRTPGARPAGRSDAWLLSRWLNAVPFHDGAPALLADADRDDARSVIVASLVADVIVLSALATLAERAGAARSWFLCRRAGGSAWELAATLAGEDFLGERWLPSRSSHPDVAAVAALACIADRAGDLLPLLMLLGLPPGEVTQRVRLRVNREAERWSIADQQLLLVDGRRLVRRPARVPATVADALVDDPAGVFGALVNGVLRWAVDCTGITPRLASGQ